MRNQWIKDRLEELGGRRQGKTQASMARAVGIDTTKISKTISGTREPQANEMIRIAQYLELPVETVISNFARQEAAPSMTTAEAAAGFVAVAESNLEFRLSDKKRADLESEFRKLLAQYGRRYSDL